MSGMAMVASLIRRFCPAQHNILGVGPAARRHGSDCCVPVPPSSSWHGCRRAAIFPPTQWADCCTCHVSQDERACTIGTQEDLKLRELRAAGSAT